MVQRFLILLLLTLSPVIGQAQMSATQVLDKMLSSVKATKTLEYRFKGKERMKTKPSQLEAVIKYQTVPKRIYVKAITPDAGTEILYGDGLYGGNAYVNPNKTLVPNIKLDPTGSMLFGERSHYPITYAGYDLLYDILTNAKKRSDYSIDEVLSLEGSITFDGRDCYVLELTDPSYTTISYTVVAGDNALKIAKKKFIPAYAIIDLNPTVKSYFGLTAGQTIKIPTSYAAKTIMYIDKKTFLPLYQQLSDLKGEFEKYEYLDLKANPTFNSSTFSEDNPEYEF